MYSSFFFYVCINVEPPKSQVIKKLLALDRKKDKKVQVYNGLRISDEEWSAVEALLDVLKVFFLHKISSIQSLMLSTFRFSKLQL